MTKNQARRQIAAHELAAERNPLKRDQHLASAAYLRRQFKLPEPISFGRDHPFLTEAQRAEEDYRTGRGPNPATGKFRNE